ncbi:hypothetical protein V1L54_16795 [Streptomyces sp. TRM 70361]|uniref:hypothetical protein n=1 Tax=Streptomyces sp. TRM 70361 TaxID=3116553 RepID=UPI002E7C1332|nr:hypothetical protein [Streptomyces sp. TRM 70361]MEE1941041.1 hypothetical protein [Streptomyces sp. TRM 70361]
MTTGTADEKQGGRLTQDARPGTVPYIAAWSRERTYRPAMARRAVGDGEGVGYLDETPYDRDGRGVLWVRQALARGSGRPQFQNVHVLRQRRAVRRMLCQVCGHPTPRGGPWLFVLRDVGRPVEEGERTTAPPVCAPCARLSVRQCPRLREGYAAALVGRAEVWGVAGIVHHPATLEPADGSLHEVAHEDPAIRWVTAHRLVLELRDCTPVDLNHLTT